MARDWITELLQNRILLTAFLGWAVAQLLKTILYWFLNHDFRWERLVGSGGMPSSHAALVLSMVTAIVKQCGPGSVEFAIGAVLAVVVLHDARGVRLETGKQAQAINAILNYLKNSSTSHFPDVELKELVGHTPFQVVVGSVIGLTVGVLFG